MFADKRPCKEDWSCERVSGRLTPGLEATGGRKCVLAGLMPEVKVPASVKAVSRLQHRSRLMLSIRFLPAGFVSHRFRHIVNDTNYKERGIFYG